MDQPVADFPTEIWVILGLIAAGSVLAMLGAMAGVVAHHAAVDATKNKVAQLRADYAKRVSDRGDREPIVVDEVVQKGADGLKRKAA